MCLDFGSLIDEGSIPSKFSYQRLRCDYYKYLNNDYYLITFFLLMKNRVKTTENKKPLQVNDCKGLNMVGPVGLEPTTKGL